MTGTLHPQDDGTGYIKIDTWNGGDPSQLQIGDGDFSFATWLKLDPGTTEPMVILSQGEVASGGAGYELSLNAGHAWAPLTFKVRDDSGTVDSLTFNSSQELRTGWHHLAGTLQRNGDIRLYVDGIPVASKVTTIADTVGGTAVFTMGARADSLTQKLHGRLDDLRVYHRAMYGSEVSAIRHGMEALAANASSTSSTGYSNRLQSDGTYVYQYDNEGNLVRKSASYPIRETTFDWDHRNRLSWVTQYGPLETVQLRLNDSGATDVEDAIHTVEAGNFYGEASVVTVPSGLELPTGQTDALQLDGSGDYVSLGLQDELVVGTSDFSVSAWFYAANTSGLQTIVSQGLAYLDGYALSVTSTGNLEFRLRDGSASQTVTIVPGVSLAGNWHHVLISVDRDGDIVPYLDGVELTSQIVATQVGGYIDGSTMFPFTVGALAGMSEFEGYLGDVRLFHEALDASWAATVAAYATSTYALLSQTQQTYDQEFMVGVRPCFLFWRSASPRHATLLAGAVTHRGGI